MKKRKSRTWVLSPVLVLLLLTVVSLSGFVVAKYIQTIPLKSNNVVFTAKLAQNVELVESGLRRKADGTYETTSDTVTNVTVPYTLIPGLDVPKDPRVVITGKTKIPARLYIEIVDTLGSSLISYSLRDCWQETTEKESQHGGKVYKYEHVITDLLTEYTFYILQNNEIIVSQNVRSASSGSLAFYAYLIEDTTTNNTN